MYQSWTGGGGLVFLEGEFTLKHYISVSRGSVFTLFWSRYVYIFQMVKGAILERKVF